jgi:hypothetical protein
LRKFPGHALAVSAVGFGVLGWRSVQDQVQLKGSVYELAILESRAAEGRGDEAEASELVLSIVRNGAWIIDSVLWPARDSIERDMEDERAMLLGPAAGDDGDKFLKLGNLGLELGWINRAESSLRATCSLAAQLALDEAARGMAPASVSKMEAFLEHMEAALLSIRVLQDKGRLEADLALNSKEQAMESARANLVAIWQKQEGTRFRRGLRSGQVVLGPEGARPIPNEKLSEIGELLFREAD